MKSDPELGKLIVCYWRPPSKEYPRWPGGWYPVPPDRRDEFFITKKGKRKQRA